MSSATLMRARLPGKIGWCVPMLSLWRGERRRGVIVTAPTCAPAACSFGAAYMQEQKDFPMNRSRALAAAGVVGNLIKTNASISGAQCGCQAEIGSACSMTAAALGELFEMGIDQIEYAAEVAMEHHLGLTCDPIGGLVQIPCIERNAMAANTAINAVRMAMLGDGSHIVTLDQAIETMKQTGEDMMAKYKETSKGGLAVNVVEC